MSNIDTNKVPPDGGYGWVVTFAYALNNVVVLPLITSFGLVFQAIQETAADTQLTTSQITIVIVLNHSIGMLLALFGGPVLKAFGYRKVAVAGATCISVGIFLTSKSSEFWQFIISYSIICSTGIAFIMGAFTLAINSFFNEKRARAMGVSMSITGIGGIGMPLLISVLIYTYGWRNATLVLSAICLHSLLAACLLRPAKWYFIDPPSSDAEEAAPLNKESEVEINGSLTTSSNVVGVHSLRQLDEPVENGVLAIKSLSMRSLSSNSSAQTRNAVSHPDIRSNAPVCAPVPLSKARYKWWESQEINLGSSINIFHESENIKSIDAEHTKTETKDNSYIAKFVQFFDLTLLTDPIFVNIIFGLSIAACVETNFALLFPLILHDMLQFDTRDIATIMSVLSFSDLLFRFVSPFIGEWCNKSPRVMYMVSLSLIIFVRTMMLFTASYIGMLVVAVALGISKALRTVYVNIVIPSYVPIHRLAFASGLQMFFNGIAIFTIGYLFSRVRESSGSYHVPIIVLNVLTFITIITWCAEFLYIRYRDKFKSQEITVK